MYTGFSKKYPVDRKLTEQEKQDILPRQKTGVGPANNASLVKMNSTFIEFVGRTYKLRGSMITFIVVVATLIFGYGIPFLLTNINWLHFDITELFGGVVLLLNIGVVWLSWYLLVSKEFFASTYYPIRLNRKTRKVYVYRHKFLGGFLEVPWEDVYFHIGHGASMDMLRDLRGEVMDGDVVKDAFAVGMYLVTDDKIRQLWEFIRCYMDEGPEHLPETTITLSVAPTWDNAYIMSASRVAIGSNGSVPPVFLPIVYLTTATRYLVMKSCKPPKWPAHVEKACAIEPNDPYRLPEPSRIGEFDEAAAAEEERLAKLTGKYQKIAEKRQGK